MIFLKTKNMYNLKKGRKDVREIYGDIFGENYFILFFEKHKLNTKKWIFDYRSSMLKEVACVLGSRFIILHMDPRDFFWVEYQFAGKNSISGTTNITRLNISASQGT